MSKKSKLKRLGAAVLILVSLALFQGSDGEDGCAGCEEKKWGTIRCVNITDPIIRGEQRLLWLGFRHEKDKYMCIDFAFDWSGANGTYDQQIEAGKYFWICYYMEGLQPFCFQVPVSAGTIKVPAGDTKQLTVYTWEK
ncbi:MAG: hypothetical protein KAT34_10095 [Candidatus Aminicenantes bacterium]|nr:hypothetical protein [Candidatus Aminicenantes bacterium]